MQFDCYRVKQPRYSGIKTVTSTVKITGKMKILYLLFFSPFISFAQTQTARTVGGNPVLMSGNEFNMYEKAGGGGIDAFSTAPAGDVRGSQFFFSDWSKGEVVTIRKEVYGDDLRFVYDKVRQQLFVRKNESDPVLLTNKDEIQTFTLIKGDSVHIFVNSKFYTADRPEVFFEILVFDSSKISLFKYIKTTLVRGNPNDMMKQSQGAVYDEFVDKNIYYLVKGKSGLVPVQLKLKSIKKAFEELDINCEAYLNSHPGTTDEKYLVDLVKSLN